MQECVRHLDCTHVAMDGLIRPARRLQGQADYRASKQRRNEAPIGDEDAIRRLVNVRSRTGAVLAILPISSNERPDEIAGKLQEALPRSVLEQIRTIATDNPSQATFDELKKDGVCPKPGVPHRRSHPPVLHLRECAWTSTHRGRPEAPHHPRQVQQDDGFCRLDYVGPSVLRRGRCLDSRREDNQGHDLQ